MTTKKLSEETEQKIVNPNPIVVITFLDRHRLAILFKVLSVRGHSHTQVATRNVQGHLRVGI